MALYCLSFTTKTSAHIFLDSGSPEVGAHGPGFLPAAKWTVPLSPRDVSETSFYSVSLYSIIAFIWALAKDF